MTWIMDFLNSNMCDTLNYLYNLNVNAQYNILNKSTNIIDFIMENYLLNSWNYFLQNDLEYKLLRQTLEHLDDNRSFKFFFIQIKKNLLLIIENLIIFFDKFYYDFLITNKNINYLIWFFYNDYLIYDFYKYNINIKSDLYYSYIIELLNELDLKYNIIHNSNSLYLKKKEVKLYDFYFFRKINFKELSYAKQQKYFLEDSYYNKININNIRNNIRIKNNFIKTIRYSFNNYGLYYDLNININKNLLKKELLINKNDNNFFRKNYYHFFNYLPVLQGKHDKYFNYFLENKILNIKNVLKEETNFQRLVRYYRWKFIHNGSFLWFKNDSWLFGYKDKNYLKGLHNLKTLKYYGGYSYWYYWFQDYLPFVPILPFDVDWNIIAANRYLVPNDIWHFYYRIDIKWLPFRVLLNDFDWNKFLKKKVWKTYFHIPTIDDIVLEIQDYKGKNYEFKRNSIIHIKELVKTFKNFYFSEDIWHTKKLILKKIKAKKAFIYYYLHIKNYRNLKLLNFLNIDLWVKQIIIRRPKLELSTKPQLFSEQQIIPVNKRKSVLKIPSKAFLEHEIETKSKKLFLRHLKCKEKIWNNWKYKFSKLNTIRNPIILSNFTFDKNTQKREGFYNLKFKHVWKISQRSIYLLSKSINYSKNLQLLIQGFWVKEYTKDILFHNRSKYFLINKIQNNKIYSNINYTSINDSTNLLINQANKKYWTNYNINSKTNVYYSDDVLLKTNDISKNSWLLNYWENDFYKRKKILSLKKYYWQFFFLETNFFFKKHLKNIQYSFLLKKIYLSFEKTPWWVTRNFNEIVDHLWDHKIVLRKNIIKEGVYIPKKNIIYRVKLPIDHFYTKYKTLSWKYLYYPILYHILTFKFAGIDSPLFTANKLMNPAFGLLKHRAITKIDKLIETGVYYKRLFHQDHDERFGALFLRKTALAPMMVDETSDDPWLVTNDIQQVRSQTGYPVYLDAFDLFSSKKNIEEPIQTEIKTEIKKVRFDEEALRKLERKKLTDEEIREETRKESSKFFLKDSNWITDYPIHLKLLYNYNTMFLITNVFANYFIYFIQNNILNSNINLNYNSQLISHNLFFDNNKLNKILLKTETFQNISSNFYEETIIYSNFFLLKLRINFLLNNFNYLIKNLFLILDFIKWTINLFVSLPKEIKIVIIIFISFIVYLIISLLLLLFLRANLPLNNIYVIKSLTNKEKDKEIKDDFWIYLGKLLKEDILFGTEQKYIYSLTDKRIPNVWVKEKLYNKYTKYINSKLQEKYNLHYNKFFFEKNLEKLENNAKIKIPFDGWAYYFIFFLRNSYWVVFFKIVNKLFNDRFLNYGRFIKSENKNLNSDILEFIRKVPESVVWNRIKFWSKFFFGIIWFVLQIVFRKTFRFVDRERYYVFFENNLVVDKPKTRKSLEKEFIEFLNSLQKKEIKSLIWYPEQIDYKIENLYVKNKSNIDFDLLSTEIEDDRLYFNYFWSILTWEYKYKSFKVSEKKESDIYWENEKNSLSEIIFLLEYKFETLKKKKQIKSFLEENEKREEYRFELKCLDYLLFNKLLDIIENENIQILLKKKIENIEKIEFNNLTWYTKYLSINRMEYKKKKESITKDKVLNSVYQKEYIIYRWFSTVGSRFYYLLSLITTLSIIWINSLKKVKYNNISLKSSWLLFQKDIKKLIEKIYWENLLLFNNFNSLKSKITLRQVLIITLFIFIPLFIYLKILIIFYIIYYYYKHIKLFLFNIIQQCVTIVFYKNNSIINFFILLNKVKNLLYFIIKFLFIDLKTGDSFLKKFYLFIYVFFGNFQKNFFFIKGAFLKGKKEKNIKQGLKNIFIWIILKLKVIWEDTIVFLKNFFILKNNKKKTTKFTLLLFLIRKNKEYLSLKIIIQEFFYNILYLLIHKYIFMYIEKNSLKIWLLLNYNKINNFIILQFNKIIIILERYKYNIILFKNIWNNSTKNEKKKIIIKMIFSIIFFPFIFIIYIIKKLFYNIFYKKWDKKFITLWISKELDAAIKRGVIAKFVYDKKKNSNSNLEYMLKEKVLKYNKKNFLYNNDSFWNIKWPLVYQIFKNIKEHLGSFWYQLLYELEELYIYYSSNSIISSSWSPYKRLWKVIKILKRNQNIKNFVVYKNRDYSRNYFLYKKWKIRKKIIRRYFIKGLINWVVYSLIKKVIFTEIKELKTQKIKFKLEKNKRYNYKIKYVSHLIYITSSLEEVPPQLWALSILYDYYYFNVIFYMLYKKDPIYHRIPKAPQHSLYVKWKISPFFGEIDDIAKLDISYWEALFNGTSFAKNLLSKKPMNIGWRYLLFLTEILSKEGWHEKKTWNDLSLTFGLTYNFNKDKLDFEGKAIQKLDHIEANTTFFAWDEDLLLRRFSREERLKTAFRFKISFETMYREDKMSSMIEEKNIEEEEEKARIFDENALTYKESLGLKFYLDVEKRLQTRWIFEKHFLNLHDIYFLDDEYFIKNEVDELLEYFGIIYYDITLNEMINTIKMLKLLKTSFIKDINIQMEPSIKINLNYEQYPDFYKKSKGLMQLTQTFFLLLGKFEEIPKYKQILVKKAGNKKLLKEIDYLKYNYYNDMITGYDLKAQLEEYNISHEYTHSLFIEKEFASMDLINIWNEIVSNRINSENKFQDISMMETQYLDLKWICSLDKQKDLLNKPLIFLNIVKWSWKQWLHFDLIEKEKLKIFKKNTIILNEKYNIWCLKLAPIRIKVPIKLEVSLQRMYNVINYRKMRTWDARNYFIPWRFLLPLVKKYTSFRLLQKYFMKTYKKEINEIFAWLAFPDKNDKESLKFQKKYSKFFVYLNNLYDLFSTFSINTMVKVSWDLLWYHKYWEEMEDFEYEDWYTMRLREFMKDESITKLFIEKYPYMLYVIFQPNSYINWFIGNTFKYKILKYIAYLNLGWAFYYSMYCPGEFLYNMWLFIIPVWTGVYFLFLWFYIRKYIKEDFKGTDLYLYKYQSSKRIPPIHRTKSWYYYNLKEWKNLESEYGINGKEDTWQTNRYIYIKNKHNTFRRETTLPLFIITWMLWQFYLTEMWRLPSWRGYDYYRVYDPEYATEGSFERFIWMYDNWKRLTSGGNIYNIWYINFFRKNKNIKLRLLDSNEEFRSYPLVRLKMNLFDPSIPRLTINNHVTLRVNQSDFGFIYFSLRRQKILRYIETKMDTFISEPPKEITSTVWKNAANKLKAEYSSKLKIDTELTISDYKNILIDAFFKNLKKTYLKIRRPQSKLDIMLVDSHKESYKDFILNSKSKTMNLILSDKIKYNLLKNDILFLEKRKSFNNGKILDIDIIFNMSKYEKHEYILYYNLMKFKIYRNFSFKLKKKTNDFVFSLLNKEIEDLKTTKFIYKGKSWSDHFLKINKLYKYINNWNLNNKKINLILDILTEKSTTFYDFYEKILRILKLYKLLSLDDIINIYIYIIKLFF